MLVINRELYYFYLLVVVEHGWMNSVIRVQNHYIQKRSDLYFPYLRHNIILSIILLDLKRITLFILLVFCDKTFYFPTK